MQNEVATKVERFARYLRRAGIHVGRDRPRPATARHRARRSTSTHIKYILLMITISRYNLFRTKHNKFSNQICRP